MARVFDELLPCSFRGVIFPCSHIKVHVTHDNVQHKHPDQDGARVEDTGLNPVTFEASIPFYNNVAPGKSEKWDNLFPTQHDALMNAMKSTASGVFQHPSFGQFIVKPASFDTSLDAARQDGATVNASWIETIEVDPVLGASITAASPLALGIQNAVDLDSRLAQTNLGGFDPDDGKISFEECLRRVSASVDKASLISRKQFGIIDRVIYRVNTIKRAVVASNDPQNWELKESLGRLLSSTVALKHSASSGQKDVRIYIAPRESSLVSIGKRFGNTVSDMIRLNPGLANAPTVQANTVVRYYVTIGYP